ncbi:dystroglycan [Plakobranchus ocellatus]|uniref:Dystroglycan n=1 Tax=Plakobranchus ocellatus TaxID=259542 RepID=A0AAV4B8G9_9GAST|nr:dystroglycan [Plakobranchus ocellatus]
MSASISSTFTASSLCLLIVTLFFTQYGAGAASAASSTVEDEIPDIPDIIVFAGRIFQLDLSSHKQYGDPRRIVQIKLLSSDATGQPVLQDLPEWLHFDTSSRVLTGLATAPGHLGKLLLQLSSLSGSANGSGGGAPCAQTKNFKSQVQLEIDGNGHETEVQDYKRSTHTERARAVVHFTQDDHSPEFRQDCIDVTKDVFEVTVTKTSWHETLSSGVNSSLIFHENGQIKGDGYLLARNSSSDSVNRGRADGKSETLPLQYPHADQRNDHNPQHEGGCEETVVASLVVCVSSSSMLLQEKVSIMTKLAQFLAVPRTSLTLTPSDTKDLMALADGSFQIVSAGPGSDLGDVGCSLEENVEFMWPLACGTVRHLTDFVRVLQHNVDGGRLQDELGGRLLLGWYVASSDSLATRRNRRRHRRAVSAKYRTPVPTPAIHPIKPTLMAPSSSVSFSDRKHTETEISRATQPSFAPTSVEGQEATPTLMPPHSSIVYDLKPKEVTAAPSMENVQASKALETGRVTQIKPSSTASALQPSETHLSSISTSVLKSPSLLASTLDLKSFALQVSGGLTSDMATQISPSLARSAVLPDNPTPFPSPSSISSSVSRSSSPGSTLSLKSVALQASEDSASLISSATTTLVMLTENLTPTPSLSSVFKSHLDSDSGQYYLHTTEKLSQIQPSQFMPHSTLIAKTQSQVTPLSQSLSTAIPETQSQMTPPSQSLLTSMPEIPSKSTPEASDIFESSLLLLTPVSASFTPTPSLHRPSFVDTVPFQSEPMVRSQPPEYSTSRLSPLHREVSTRLTISDEYSVSEIKNKSSDLFLSRSYIPDETITSHSSTLTTQTKSPYTSMTDEFSKPTSSVILVSSRVIKIDMPSSSPTRYEGTMSLLPTVAPSLTDPRHSGVNIEGSYGISVTDSKYTSATSIVTSGGSMDIGFSETRESVGSMDIGFSETRDSVGSMDIGFSETRDSVVSPFIHSTSIAMAASVYHPGPNVSSTAASPSYTGHISQSFLPYDASTPGLFSTKAVDSTRSVVSPHKNTSKTTGPSSSSMWKTETASIRSEPTTPLYRTSKLVLSPELTALSSQTEGSVPLSSTLSTEPTLVFTSLGSSSYATPFAAITPSSSAPVSTSESSDVKPRLSTSSAFAVTPLAAHTELMPSASHTPQRTRIVSATPIAETGETSLLSLGETPAVLRPTGQTSYPAPSSDTEDVTTVQLSRSRQEPKATQSSLKRPVQTEATIDPSRASDVPSSTTALIPTPVLDTPSPSTSTTTMSTSSTSTSTMSAPSTSTTTVTSARATTVDTTQSPWWPPYVTTNEPFFTREYINNRPFLERPIDVIRADVGRLLEFSIPMNTFYDVEDGDTSQLALSLELPSRQHLPATFWLFLETRLQILIGLPLQQDMSAQNTSIVLVARDSKGLAAKHLILLQITDQPGSSLTHRFTMLFRTDFQQFMRDRWNLTELLRRVSEYFGDGSAATYITVLEVRQGSLQLTWTNSSLSSDSECPNKELKVLFNRMVRRDGSVRSSFSRHLGRYLQLSRVDFQLLGVCDTQFLTTAGPTTTEIVLEQIDDGLSIWAHVILPVLIAILVFFLLILIFVLCNRRRRELQQQQQNTAQDVVEKEAISNDRHPVIFPDELDLIYVGGVGPGRDRLESNFKPRDPLVLPSDCVDSRLYLEKGDRETGGHPRRPNCGSRRSKDFESVRMLRNSDFGASSNGSGRNSRGSRDSSAGAGSPVTYGHEADRSQQQQQQQQQPDVVHLSSPDGGLGADSDENPMGVYLPSELAPDVQQSVSTERGKRKKRSGGRKRDTKDSRKKKWDKDRGVSVSASSTLSWDRPNHHYLEEEEGASRTNTLTSVKSGGRGGDAGGSGRSPPPRSPPPYWQTQGDPPPYRLPPSYIVSNTTTQV